MLPEKVSSHLLGLQQMSPRQRLGLIGKSISPSVTGADSISPSVTGAAVAVLIESETQPVLFLSLLSHAFARAGDENGSVNDSPTPLPHSATFRSSGNRTDSGPLDMGTRTGHPTPLLARNTLQLT